MRLLLYALGGGLGHLTRATALGRVAARRGHEVHLLTNSPLSGPIPVERELGARGRITRLPACRDPAEVVPDIRRIVTAGDFDALVVDTFPRGLGGELADLIPDLAAATFWVQRDLCPRYAEAANLASLADAFDAILQPGEAAPVASAKRGVWTAPWLLRNPSELVAREPARRALGVPSRGTPVVIVVGCGLAEEVSEAAALAEQLQASLAGRALVRWAAPDPGPADGLFYWPLLELHAGIDVLVGAGGYNTVHEARATATPLVALARPRRYDRQARRLSPAEHARDPADLASRVSAHLGRRAKPDAPAPAFENGAAAAIAAIEARM